jgi:4-hydroxy-3-polyprenylbenzoate decarboxylase
LESLKPLEGIETHLVISRAAGITIRLECPQWELEAVKALADVSYKEMDIAATIASGSFPIDAMIVVPCSMKTVAQIATGTGETLLHRAADVTLKERRPLYVVPRETPFHLGHLRNLTTLAELGAVIVPPMVAFYHQPSSVDDIVNHTVGKLLDLLKVEHELYKRWEGPKTNRP